MSLRALSLLLLLAVTACSGASGMSSALPATPSYAAPAAVKSHGYVYVADGKAKALIVYPMGYASAPIRTVPLDGSPFGLCSDKNSGRVYATERQNNEVQVFSSGAADNLGTMDASQPTDCTVVDGKLYVANYTVLGQKYGSVSVYVDGSFFASQAYNAPSGSAVLGIAVDAQGNRFETLLDKNAIGTLVKYAPGTSDGNLTVIKTLGRPCWCGVTTDGHGNVIANLNGSMTEFVAPDFTRTRTIIPFPGKLGILTYFTHTDLGTFVPLNGGDGRSIVAVYPASGSEKPYALSEGLEDPLASTSGQ